jgi:transcriptional regulator with XRE-family HTH domain
MKVTAVTKFKQGDLYNALKKLGWTQAELAKRAGVSQHTIGHALNLRYKPSPSNIDRIQKALAKAGEYLDVLSIWPEDFKGLDKSVTVEQTKEVDLALIGANTPVLHDTMKPNFDDARKLIDETLSELTPKQASYIRETFLNEKTCQEAGKEVGKTRSNYNMLRNTALRKLRASPRLIKKLQEAKECICLA